MMTFISLAAVFIFGTIMGSFLNVVIIRFASGRSIVSGRSACGSCGVSLTWKELVPVVSYIVLQGRCRSCRTRIGMVYPIVEIVTGTLFAFIFWRVSPLVLYGSDVFIFFLADMVLLWVISSLLIVMTVYDMRHMIIPNVFAYTFAGFSLAYTMLPSLYFGLSAISVQDILWGPVFAVPFVLLWFFSKGTWMGLGDAKLVLGMAWLLGIWGTVSALLLAFWIGALYGLLVIGMHKWIPLLAKGKRFTMKSEIPFGPFLILGLVLVFLFQVDVISWIV